MQINEPRTASANNGNALFNLGFRIFFLSAGIFSVISMLLWVLLYQFNYSLAVVAINSLQWHSHEMIYGYALAVIAGFLLTAVKNWTGVQTLTGKPLMMVFLIWLVARILFMFGDQYILMAAFFDITFSVVLLVAVSVPVIKVKQWSQIAILSKLVLIAAFNLVFYLGVFAYIDQGVQWGIYGGLYLVIGLILTMGRRVVPFFIERGVGYNVTLYNSKWLDISSLILFFSFFITELFTNNAMLSAYLAMGVFIVNAVRLVGWHTKGIWKKSLLWSLYLAFWFITSGFALMAASYFLGISKYLAIHALAVGGIGLITMGMMSRVALGHTGRDVNKPSKLIDIALSLLVVAVFFRVVLPLFDASQYSVWVGVSQGLWIVAFLIFSAVYWPILTKARLDNQPG